LIRLRVEVEGEEVETEAEGAGSWVDHQVEVEAIHQEVEEEEAILMPMHKRGLPKHFLQLSSHALLVDGQSHVRETVPK
jgi:hypothetical protein